MGMITTNPLFLLTRISKNTRIFIAASVIAGYGLFLYELLPEYLFIPMSAIIYFGMPSILVCIVLVLLPRLLSRGTSGEQQASTGADQSGQQQAETVSFDQSEPGMILPDNGVAGIAQAAIQGETATTSDAQPPAIIQGPGVDEMAVQDMVSRAMEPVQKDSSRMQDTIGDLRNEINSIKNSMDALASTVESSLTDLKSFQAELANPLNFMRKYFDTIDIKSLSDPSLPLHVEQLPLDTMQNTNAEKPTSEGKAEPRDGLSKLNESAPEQGEKNVIELPVSGEPNEVLAFKQMLGGKITLGRLMTTISLMEEILQTLGRDSIDVLIEQCKLMGLNQEDEHIVYNVINMMDKSGLSVNDTLIMLYKFGKVMGMNDRESDLIYAKLMMNQGKNHDNIMTVEKKVG